MTRRSKRTATFSTDGFVSIKTRLKLWTGGSTQTAGSENSSYSELLVKHFLLLFFFQLLLPVECFSADVPSSASIAPVLERRSQRTKSTFKGNLLLSKATRTSADLGPNRTEEKTERSVSPACGEPRPPQWKPGIKSCGSKTPEFR